MASTNEHQLKKRRKAKKGDRGQALYIKRDSSWWQVTSEDADREKGWKEGPYGCYGPFASILADDPNVFPDYEIEDGAIVRVYVEVVRP